MRVHIFSTECTYYSSVVPILCGIAPRGYVEPAVEAPAYIRQGGAGSRNKGYLRKRAAHKVREQARRGSRADRALCLHTKTWR